MKSVFLHFPFKSRERHEVDKHNQSLGVEKKASESKHRRNAATSQGVICMADLNPEASQLILDEISMNVLQLHRYLPSFSFIPASCRMVCAW